MIFIIHFIYIYIIHNTFLYKILKLKASIAKIIKLFTNMYEKSIMYLSWK